MVIGDRFTAGGENLLDDLLSGLERRRAGAVRLGAQIVHHHAGAREASSGTRGPDRDLDRRR